MQTIDFGFQHERTGIFVNMTVRFRPTGEYRFEIVDVEVDDEDGYEDAVDETRGNVRGYTGRCFFDYDDFRAWVAKREPSAADDLPYDEETFVGAY